MNCSENEREHNFEDSVTTNFTEWRYQWNFLPAMEAIILPCVIILNIVILTLFINSKRLSLPFNIYLTGVLISNLLFAILNDPLDIVNFISPYWWLGDSLCTLYLYAQNIPSGIVMYSHILVTTNRIWAVTFPHSYRQRHSVKVAVFLVILVWVYVHIVFLPIVLMDAFLYRLPVETSGCTLNTEKMPVWANTCQFMLFILPNLFIILAYPYLVVKRRRTRTVAANCPEGPDNTGKTGSSVAPPPTHARRPQKSKRAFAVFTVLTVSVVVCWTPLNTFYAVWSFVDLSSHTTVLQFCQGLFVVQPALDPVFFGVIMPGIRLDFKQFCRKFRVKSSLGNHGHF